MKTISSLLFTWAIPLMVISVSDCGNKKKNNPENNMQQTETAKQDTFIYKFHDASVPPPYHRSYTIQVKPGQVYYAISGYGEVLADDSLTLTKSRYDSFVKSLNDLHITGRNEDEQHSCTGGTSDELILHSGSREEVKGYIYYCGGQMYGNLEGDVAAAAGLFKELIPDLPGKINATRKDN